MNETPVNRILIAGCGYVGSHLAGRLASEGRTVWGLKRNRGELPDGVETVIADLTRPDTLSSVPEDVGAVVYCPARGAGGNQGYRDIFIDGLQNLLDVLVSRRSRPERFVFVSSTSVYGQHGGEWVDEDSPTEPRTEAGPCMLEAEQIVWDSPLPAVVVRFSGIYGPGRSRLLRAVREGRDTGQRTAGRWLNQIHRDDCAGVLRHLLVHSEPAAIYVASDSEPTLRDDVLDWLVRRMGQDAVHRPIAVGATASRTPRSDKRVSNRRLLESGYTFRFPTFREGYEDVIKKEARE